MSVSEVVDWIESDCVGMGEEYIVEVVVNGVSVYFDEVGSWIYDNVKEGEENYEDRVIEEFGEDKYCEGGMFWNWKVEELEKME